MSANVATRLLQHYVDNFRRLPWRAPPGSPPTDPYFVWLSEVMLQQTTVAAVVPRFQRFVDRWPTIAALAAASDADVMQEWAGLGYYARARNLIACARRVAELGGFPRDEAGLRRLPGIGDYTAAAIAAIAFGQDSAPVDTNVERVVARIHGLTGKDSIRAAATAMVPRGRAGDFAQAMMDLGAAICRPKAPLCRSCPLAASCRAFALGTPETFPQPKIRKARPQRHGLAHWIERDGCIWLVRRPTKGVLGGMAALPGPDWEDEPLAGPAIARVRHVFTHFTLELAVVPTREPWGDGWWQPLDRLADAGLPTLYRRAAEAVLGSRTALAA
jgi:A/G-specific adenine glycosylase